MSIFSDDRTKEVQFNLFQECLDALFVGIIVVNARHEILYANNAVASKVNYEQGYLIGRQIHELLPPDFRERHKMILERFFENPYHVAIERREGNLEKMKMVPRGTDKEPDKWLPVRIGIHPLFVDPSSEVFQTAEVVKRLQFGLAEVSFAGTFNE